MKNRKRLAALGMAVSLGITLGPTQARAEQRYWVTDVGTAGGDSASFRAINESGQVVGSTGSGPYLYSNGQMKVLVPPGSAGGGDGWDVNESGAVVGSSGYDFFFQPDAVGTNGTFYDLSALGGAAVWTYGQVNEAGQVPGINGVWQAGAVTPLPRPVAQINNRGLALGAGDFMYVISIPDGKVTDLPLRATGNVMDTQNRYINDNGMVVGAYDGAQLPDGSFEKRLGLSWNGGTPIDIGYQLAGNGTPLAEDVRGMNANNDVFGNAWGPNLNRGFLFDYDHQKVVDVGTLGGSTCLHGVNAAGDVAGHSSGPGDRPYFGQFVSHGAGAHIVATAAGKIYDLNAVIPASTPFDLTDWDGAINDKGQILARAWNVNGGEHTLLLTPLPVTTATASGTPRGDGWYTSDVKVTLTGVDKVTGLREVRYRVDGGNETRVTGATATVTLTKNGTHTVSFFAIDAKGHVEDTKYFNVSIAKPGLVVSTATLPFATTNVSYTTTLAATGLTGTRTWTATGLPRGLTLATNGTLSGKVTTAGIYRFTATVKVGTTATSTAYLTLDCTDALTIGLSMTAAQRYAVSLYAKGGRAPYSYRLDAAPAGVTIEGATLYGVAVGQAITLTVTDARGVPVTKPLTVVEYAPVVATPTTAALTVAPGQAVTLKFTATGGKPGSKYTWAWDQEIGTPGLKLDRAAGKLTGAIATPGTYAVNIMAQDEDGNVGSATATVTVQ
jgi:hypothetical protein